MDKNQKVELLLAEGKCISKKGREVKADYSLSQFKTNLAIAQKLL